MNVKKPGIFTNLFASFFLSKVKYFIGTPCKVNLETQRDGRNALTHTQHHMMRKFIKKNFEESSLDKGFFVQALMISDIKISSYIGGVFFK